MRAWVCAWIVCLLAATPFAAARAAECGPDEVKVGEDANYIYCKNRQVYAACVREAGERSRGSSTQRRCAARVEQIADSFSYKLTAAALGCLGSCGAAAMKKDPVSTSACFVTCGVAATAGTEMIDRSVAEMNNCYEEALVRQRQDLENCKR